MLAIIKSSDPTNALCLSQMREALSQKAGIIRATMRSINNGTFATKWQSFTQQWRRKAVPICEDHEYELLADCFDEFLTASILYFLDKKPALYDDEFRLGFGNFCRNSRIFSSDFNRLVAARLRALLK
jgi:hypothetical protein